MKTADGSACYVLDLDLTIGSLVKLASSEVLVSTSSGLSDQTLPFVFR